MQLQDHWKELADKGLKILKEWNIVYMALEMRVGKTPTSLKIAHNFGAFNILFVTPKKAIQGIKDFYTDLKYVGDLMVLNYEQLHNYQGDPDLVIIDEAHKCGAFPKPTERAKLLKQICLQKPVIYLSGTPSPESYSQLYHQFWISSHSPWKNYKNFYAWANDYVKIGKKYFSGQAINDYSKANRQKIDSETAHLFVSYTQKEAGFKQEIKEEVLQVRMLPATYSLAEKLIKNRIYTGKNGAVVLGDTSVKLQNKIHQIHSGTVITESGDTSAIIFDRSKVSLIADIFATKKIAIFYKFVAEMVMIKTHLGRWTTDDPKKFNESADLVFLSQIQSGSEGVDLKTADAIIFINIDFSAKSYIQARQRLQFKDRTTPAKVYFIFAENGIENLIYERVRNKLDFTNGYFKQAYGIKDTDGDKNPTGPPGVGDGEDNKLFPARLA